MKKVSSGKNLKKSKFYSRTQLNRGNESVNINIIKLSKITQLFWYWCSHHALGHE